MYADFDFDKHDRKQLLWLIEKTPEFAGVVSDVVLRGLTESLDERAGFISPSQLTDRIWQIVDNEVTEYDGFCCGCGNMVNGVFIDQGIGAYEFWGAHYVDANVEWCSPCCECDIYQDANLKLIAQAPAAEPEDADRY